MHSLVALWLPILLSAVIVFIASSVIHMFLPWHKGDHGKVPAEDKFRDAVRPFALPPGDYFVPRCESMKEMKTPEFAEKMKQGPIILMTVYPNGQASMGKSLALWFLYLLAVGLFTAYIVRHGVPAGAGYSYVFRMAGVAAFLGYAGALWQLSIWYRRSWGTTIRTTIDGLIYAALTAGTFGWLWPR
jgi:hypothetical protein